MDCTLLLPRGVYRAPCLGPQGETILYAVDHNHRLIDRAIGGVAYVLPGDNPLDANDHLWELLNGRDPESEHPNHGQQIAS